MLISLLLVLLTGTGPVSAQGQARDGERPGLGLRPPTEEERAWMQRNMLPTKEVKLNKLGVDRVNADRRLRGLPLITLPPAADGHEVLSAVSGEQGGGLAGAGVGAGSLPSGVDNSTLPSFPPIRSQGSIGSCASFSSVYYAATHMLGLARGLDNRNNSDNSTKLSPKWTYPMVNGGADSGSWFPLEILLKHGAATWQDFPYSGTSSDPKSYREWSIDPAVWRKAAGYRFASAGTVASVNTAGGLDQIKTLLSNGYVLLFATNIYGWQFTTIGNDPATTEDDAFAGKKVCSYVKTDSSGHALTVVGYNDAIWIDINKNGVVDSGEKGALRIANSWGTTWGVSSDPSVTTDGFTWIAYDALRTTSAVIGANQNSRAQAPYGAWWFDEAHWITARPAYTPSAFAEFTINHAKRDQLNIRLGRSATSAVTPATFWQGAMIARTNTSSYHQSYSSGTGGPYPLDGTSAAQNGTFVFDLTEIVNAGSNRYYVSVTDATAGSPAALSGFKLTDAAGNQITTVGVTGVPGTADNTTIHAYLDYTANAPVITSAATTSGPLGTPFTFAIQATNGPTSFGTSNLPAGLSLNPTTGVISGTPTVAGNFTVGVSANNSTGTGSNSLALTITQAFSNPPVITSTTTTTTAVGASFSYAITATNSPLSFGATNLPAGLGLNAATGVISGTPIQAGTFNVFLSAANGGGTGTRALTLTVNPAPNGTPVITSAASYSATAGSAFTYRILASNNPTTFGAPNLPSELTLNATTGIISGMPTVARSYAVTLTATNAIGTGYLPVNFIILGGSSFAPSNDDFANRITLGGTSATSSGTNNNATAQTGEPAHAGIPASRSVWWKWTAPSSGSVTLDTIGSSFDTLLAVYTGSAVGSLAAIASDDQSGGSNTSRVIFNATAGTTYQIAVDGLNGATGAVALHLVQTASGGGVPANDMFTNASLLIGTTTTASGSNTAASAETGEPSHAGNAPSKSVWWRWTAPFGGVVQVSTVGSNFDTLLAIYTGTTVANLTAMASDDESGGNGTSRTSFTALPGVTYRIAVDGWSGSTGNITLNLQLGNNNTPSNDAFSSRTALAGATVATTGTNVAATAETAEPAHAGETATSSVWWSWTAPSAGVVTINTSGSSFDTVLAVYTGSPVGALFPVASNDDSGGSQTSSVSFVTTAGTSYAVAVDGFNGDTGSVALNVLFTAGGGIPANDNFANRITLTGQTPAGTGINVGATAEVGEPAHAGPPAERSVWWTWTAPGTGQAVFNTSGSTFDTILAVYSGNSLASLSLVGANDDNGSNSTSRVNFQAVAGRAYQIVVGGYSGSAGTVALNGSLTPNNGVLYQTDFEAFETGLETLVGNDGWLGSNVSGGVQGVINAFTGRGKGGYLGFNIPSNARVSVVRQLNFNPIAQGSPKITIGAEVQVVDSDNGRPDKFALTIHNIAGDYLAGIVFDNANNSIFTDNTVSLTDTTKKFSNSTHARLEVSIDFQLNKWSATLGGVVLFTDKPFHSGTKTLTLGDVGFDWLVQNISLPGDNFILFDDFAIGNTVVPLPVITSPPTASVAVGTSFFYSITATSSPTSFGATGLPSGLTLNPATGLISGAISTAGSYPVTISATNPSGIGEGLLTITASTDAPKITSTVTASGRQGEAFTYQITAINNPASFSAVNLPAGLTINALTGLISGIPTGNGTTKVGLEATNASGLGTALLTVTVARATGGRGVITSPANGATLASASAAFAWSPGTSSTAYWLHVGSALGGYDLYNSSNLTSTVLTQIVNGLPTDGRTIYVRLWSLVNGVWAADDYAYKAFTGPSLKAQISSPRNATTLDAGTVPFSWNAGTGTLGYWLYVGSTQGGYDLYNSGNLSSSVLAQNVSALPADGRIIYVRLWSLVGGGWVYEDYAYKAFTGTSPKAQIVTPQNGATFTSSTAPFSWNAGSGATAFWLYVGSTSGGFDLYNSGSLASSILTRTVTGLPGDGRTLFVRLWSLVGGTWVFEDSSYKAFTGGSPKAQMTIPTSGTTLASGAVPFTWIAGNGAAGYWLYVGSASGGSDLYDSGNLSSTVLTRSVSGLPADGRTLYVRLWSLVGTSWDFTDYSYKAFTGASPKAQMTTPANGTRFTSGTVPFAWSAGNGATGYWLYVGNTQGGDDLHNSNNLASTVQTRTVGGLPIDGRTIFVRLWSLVGGTWVYNDYTYTAR